MPDTDAIFKTLTLGTRSSALALWQAEFVAARLREWLPDVRIEICPMSSPGDRDQSTDLRESPLDFFTRDLDRAVCAGELNAAVHSAKDLPSPMPEGLDWCWLPWRADPRDVLVLRQGVTCADLPAKPRMGISSDRRDAYCRMRFPDAVFAPLRGSIEHRMAQLDRGDFDVLIIAGAAMQRLGLSHRISEWISLDDLPVPDGQGVLALTFRAGDFVMQKIRGLFVKSVRIVGAGVGQAGYCTWAGVQELRAAEVCLYDALLDPALLSQLPPGSDAVFVGKRCGRASLNQAEIIDLMLEHVRRGRRIVRLKGGDPGVFGRLSEEVAALDAYGIPVQVLPGVSSLQVASTGTGIVLTQRGASRGFCAMTPMQEGGRKGSVGASERARLPVAFFMVMHSLADVKRDLLGDGWSTETPASAIFSAGTAYERIVTGTLADIVERVADYKRESRTSGAVGEKPGDPAVTDPGLLVVGAGASSRYPHSGPLGGVRVLLTCSDALLDRSARAVCDMGGRPLLFPMISLKTADDLAQVLRGLAGYDWIVLTSPSAVRCLMDGLRKMGLDVRVLPRIMTCGAETSAALCAFGLHADLAPDDPFSAAGLLAKVRETIKPEGRILRLCSDKAGTEVSSALTDMGFEVRDAVLYTHEECTQQRLPDFDAAFFASGSAVKAFVSKWGVGRLAEATVAAIGEPTAQVLRNCGREPDVLPAGSTAKESIMALAKHYLRKQIYDIR